MRQKYPTEVAEIEKSLHVDDVISGGENTEAVHSLKAKAVEIFERGKFTLHKWHSNKPDVERGASPQTLVKVMTRNSLVSNPGKQNY
jgi:hypothetical protein